MYSVILCGGSGTRLWPLSRDNFPKQFLKLYNDKSLLQETFLRMGKIMPKDNIFLVTNKEGGFHVYNQIKEIYPKFKKSRIIIEPAGRNTAPAMALAVKYLLEKIKIEEKDPIIFLPSDHYIAKEKKYSKVIKNALKNVGGHIGTVGIVPTRPETGYGYVKKGKKSGPFYFVEEFKEKPDRATAQKYLKSGKYLWNSGIYFLSGRTFILEISKHSPEINSVSKNKLSILIQKFPELPSISFDYAVSEKSKNVVVFDGNFGWSDIGSFDSLSEILGDEKAENSRVISVNSKNIFAHSATNRLIVTSGVRDLIVVENNDTIMVIKKGKGEEVKKIVDYLRKNNVKELKNNLLVHRPWGTYEVLSEGCNYKVKKISVYPHSKLSLQSHNKRAEHWVVVKGMARVIVGKKISDLRENESVFVPIKTRHRLENPGKNDVEIIEVQTGNYLEEDDIVRYEDIYKRN